MRIRRLFFIGVMVTLGSCEGCKDDPKPVDEINKLPAATQSGKQTFGCLIDGKAWVVNGYYFVSALYQEGVLTILSSEQNKKIDRTIYIVLYEGDLLQQTYYPEQLTNMYDYLQHCEYNTSADLKRRLVITHFDPDKYIIAGTFEFEAYSTKCDKAVEVTEGRFDLNYAP